MTEKPVGKVEHFFDKISVAAIKLTGTLKAGDTIHVKSTITDFTQKVDSIQIAHEVVKEAKKGQDVGIKMAQPVKGHADVFVVTA